MLSKLCGFVQTASVTHGSYVCPDTRLLRVYKAISPEVSDFHPSIGQEDVASVQILTQFHGSVLEMYSPRKVAGDGNCMYRVHH